MGRHNQDHAYGESEDPANRVDSQARHNDEVLAQGDRVEPLLRPRDRADPVLDDEADPDRRHQWRHDPAPFEAGEDGEFEEDAEGGEEEERDDRAKDQRDPAEGED